MWLTSSFCLGQKSSKSVSMTTFSAVQLGQGHGLNFWGSNHFRVVTLIFPLNNWRRTKRKTHNKNFKRGEAHYRPELDFFGRLDFGRREHVPWKKVARTESGVQNWTPIPDRSGFFHWLVSQTNKSWNEKEE